LQLQALPQATLGLTAPLEQPAVHAPAPHVTFVPVQDDVPLQPTRQKLLSLH
jgi:hypothetical protein